MEDKDFKVVVDKAMDYSYSYYENDHCIRVCVSQRTSEPWHDI